LVSFQLLPGGVGFPPTPPGRSWFPSNSSRKEFPICTINIYYFFKLYYGIYCTPEFLIAFYLIYLRLDILVIDNIWYLIAFDLLYHLIICIYLYWYLPCYFQLLPALVSFQLLPGGVDFPSTPPGRSWFPSNSPREEFPIFRGSS
jgi:hypothetical protein